MMLAPQIVCSANSLESLHSVLPELLELLHSVLPELLESLHSVLPELLESLRSASTLAPQIVWSANSLESLELAVFG